MTQHQWARKCFPRPGCVSQQCRRERRDHSPPHPLYLPHHNRARQLRSTCSWGTCLPGKSRVTSLALRTVHQGTRYDCMGNAAMKLCKCFSNYQSPPKSCFDSRGLHSPSPPTRFTKRALAPPSDSVCPWALASLTRQREACTCQPCKCLCPPPPRPPPPSPDPKSANNADEYKGAPQK